jgi:hypothetical protein
VRTARVERVIGLSSRFVLRLLAVVLPAAFAAAAAAEPVAVQARFRADREALATLDRELWAPLTAAYAENRVDDYLGSFAPDALIAGGDIPSLSPFAEWRRGVERRFLVRRGQVGQFRLEHRFTERAVYRDWSSERGVAAETDPNETLYHEFHTFGRRLDGRWRIVTTYRKRLPREAGAAAFAAAAAVGDHERF